MLRVLCCISALFVVALAQINIPANFDRMEHATDFANNIRKYLISANRSISDECQVQLDFYSRGLQNLDRWALEMLDSTAKIPAGILNGNSGELGVFDECLNIEENIGQQTITGKYCLGAILLSLTSLANGVNENSDLLKKRPEIPGNSGPSDKSRITGRSGIPGMASMLFHATCAPSKCSAREIQGLYNSLMIPIGFTDELCQDKLHQLELETGGIITVVFLGIVLGIIVVSSIYDTVLYYSNKKPSHIALTSFSVLTNMKKLTHISNNPDQLTCLHGIRTMSLTWVILGHRYSLYRGVATSNLAYMDEWARNGYNMFVLGAHVSVDTFLMLSGFLITYTYMSSVAKGMKFNILQYYLHRFIRLTPPFAALVLVVATLFQFFGSGPLWPIMNEQISGSCRDNWWSALLYVQNYVNPEAFCLLHTWYLCVDVQLFLLSPIILIPLKKKPKVGLALLGIATIAAILSPFLIAWFYEIRTLTLSGGTLVESEDFNFKFNYVTHARASPWTIGLALGYLMFQTKRNGIEKLTAHKYFKPIMLSCWCLCMLIIYGCVFGWHNVMIDPKYNQFEHSAQIGFTRPAWAIAVGWIVFACVHGFGGPVNWFLSLGVFQFISRISYSMYLLHMFPFLIQAASTKVALYFGNFETLYLYWGDLFYSAMLALIWVLAFESPIVALEKVMFSRRPRSKPKEGSVEKQNHKVQENDNNRGLNPEIKQDEFQEHRKENGKNGIGKTIIEIDDNEEHTKDIKRSTTPENISNDIKDKVS